MSDVKQQLDRRGNYHDWSAVACESHRDRDRVSGEVEYPHLLPTPLATEAQCSLACMLLQAWTKAVNALHFIY